MNCASTTMPVSRRSCDRLLVLGDRRFLVEQVELELRRGLGAERDVDEAGLAIERQHRLVAQHVGDAGVDAPQNVEVAGDQLLAERDELLLVDGRLLVGEDEEADIVVALQRLDLVDDLLRDRGCDSRARTSIASRTSR